MSEEKKATARTFNISMVNKIGYDPTDGSSLVRFDFEDFESLRHATEFADYVRSLIGKGGMLPTGPRSAMNVVSMDEASPHDKLGEVKKN